MTQTPYTSLKLDITNVCTELNVIRARYGYEDKGINDVLKGAREPATDLIRRLHTVIHSLCKAIYSYVDNNYSLSEDERKQLGTLKVRMELALVDDSATKYEDFYKINTEDVVWEKFKEFIKVSDTICRPETKILNLVDQHSWSRLAPDAGPGAIRWETRNVDTIALAVLCTDEIIYQQLLQILEGHYEKHRLKKDDEENLHRLLDELFELAVKLRGIKKGTKPDSSKAQAVNDAIENIVTFSKSKKALKWLRDNQQTIVQWATIHKKKMTLSLPVMTEETDVKATLSRSLVLSETVVHASLNYDNNGDDFKSSTALTVIAPPASLVSSSTNEEVQSLKSLYFKLLDEYQKLSFRADEFRDKSEREMATSALDTKKSLKILVSRLFVEFYHAYRAIRERIKALQYTGPQFERAVSLYDEALRRVDEFNDNKELFLEFAPQLLNALSDYYYYVAKKEGEDKMSGLREGDIELFNKHSDLYEVDVTNELISPLNEPFKQCKVWFYADEFARTELWNKRARVYHDYLILALAACKEALRMVPPEKGGEQIKKDLETNVDSAYYKCKSFPERVAEHIRPDIAISLWYDCTKLLNSAWSYIMNRLCLYSIQILSSYSEQLLDAYKIFADDGIIMNRRPVDLADLKDVLKKHWKQAVTFAKIHIESLDVDSSWDGEALVNNANDVRKSIMGHMHQLLTGNHMEGSKYVLLFSSSIMQAAAVVMVYKSLGLKKSYEEYKVAELRIFDAEQLMETYGIFDADTDTGGEEDEKVIQMKRDARKQKNQQIRNTRTWWNIAEGLGAGAASLALGAGRALKAAGSAVISSIPSKAAVIEFTGEVLDFAGSEIKAHKEMIADAHASVVSLLPSRSSASPDATENAQALLLTFLVANLS